MTYQPTHITNFPVVAQAAPAGYGATAQEIVNAVYREELSGTNVNGAGLGFIRLVFDAVKAPDWKAAVVVNRARDAAGRNIAEWVAAALIWFHADSPRIVDAGEMVLGAGYCAD